MQKLLSRLGLLIVIISFSGCGHNLPTKPSIDSGILILQENVIFYVNNQTGEERDVEVCMADGLPNPELEKVIVHSNEDWNKVMLYIRLLEKRVPKRVKKQLLRIRKSSKILNQKANLYGL